MNTRSLTSYFVIPGCRQKSTKPSARIFISCYWILTITITATYSGNLIAFMTVKKVKVPINSLRELVENPDYQAGVAFGGSTHGLFKVNNIILKVDFIFKMNNHKIIFVHKRQ